MNLNSLARQRGLSLIELMIALVLSALLLWGVLKIFDSNRNTMRMQNAFARVQESGRFAIDLLTREIRMADYWGCAPSPGSIRNHLDTGDADYNANVLNNLGTNGILGADNVSGETIGGKAVLDGTDILYLRGSEDACDGTGRMVPSEVAASIMASQNCGVQEGQVVLLTNCQSGELMTITNVQAYNTGGSSEKRTLVHNTGHSNNSGWIDNASQTLQREYGADSRILVPYQHIYFIANNDATNTPSLFISDNGAAPQELIPGIDDMQILYGRDTDGDDLADTWSIGSSVGADMQQALALKIQLVAAGDSSINADDLTVTDLDSNSTTYSDGKLRKIYLATAKIRNRGDM